jgi:winged helix DNA-binding protein
VTLNIPLYRLHNQRLSRTTFKTPNEVLSWLGAVQAQDYAGAKWALAQRMTDATDAALDQAFADGSILRSHLLRPTWHFATPTDIRWLLQLTAPRVHAMNAFMYRQSELDKATFKKSYAVLENSLRDGKQLTRTELASALEKAGILAAGVRLAYIIMSAELDGLLISGARRGKQFTYALLEERVLPVKALNREEALSEMMKRYFITRGPARLTDFVWWSGLTMADAKKGIEMVKPQFVNERIDGQEYWFSDTKPPKRGDSPQAFLLPNYDEYFIGLKDRSAIGEFVRQANIPEYESALVGNVIILNGQIAGGWRRTLGKDKVLVETSLITKLSKAEKGLVAEAADRLGKFLELPVSIIHKEHSNEQRKTRSL